MGTAYPRLSPPYNARVEPGEVPDRQNRSNRPIRLGENTDVVAKLIATAAAAGKLSTARLPSASPAPPRRRRYGWWIAGGIFAVLIALPLGTGLYFAKPIKILYDFMHGMMTGDPSFPGCDTTIARETTAGPLWYRVSKVSCPGQGQRYFVYAKPSPNAGYWLVLMSDDSPVPVSVRQIDDRHFQIVFATPLADGRTSVPLVLNEDGSVSFTDIQIFDHGRPNSPSTRK